MKYCNIVYAQMLMYMINKLKRIQNATGGYIFERYGTIHDVIILHWLPKKEHTQFNSTKLVDDLYTVNFGQNTYQ